MRQMRVLSSLIFFSFFVFSSIHSAYKSTNADYCNSGVVGCKCGKPKPPGFYAKSKQVNMPVENMQPVSTVTRQDRIANYEMAPSKQADMPAENMHPISTVTKQDRIANYEMAPSKQASMPAQNMQRVSTTAGQEKTASYAMAESNIQPAISRQEKDSRHEVASKKPQEENNKIDNKQALSELAQKQQRISNNIAAASESPSRTRDLPENVKSARENQNSTRMNPADNSSSNKSSNGSSDYSNTAAVKGCEYGPACEFSTGVNVRVKNPQLCMLGGQFSVEYEVFATSDVRDVVLTAETHENATYVSSQPEAKVSRRELTWNLGEMKKGQRLSGKILLKSNKEGDICTCFNVKAAAGACCSTMCAKAALACESSGPLEVIPGEQFSYVVSVINTGSYPAQDVVLAVTDNDKVAKALNFNLGTIEPGKTRKVTIPVTAVNRGKISYNAIATSSTADKISKDLSTLVTSYSLDCAKNGPKTAFLGQKAPYQIVVNNTGDRDLHDVVITETVHPATTIVAAEGATIRDRAAVWKIPVLKAGEKANFKIALTTRNKGAYTNITTVSNREAYNTTRETITDWKGRAALDMSMNTSENSIFIGETTRYKINIINQGQETDTNVTVAAIFPEGLEPVNASGDSEATINGQTVNFAPKNLGPRQTLEHFVTVKATKQGDLRPKVQVSSDSIKPPITQEESLIVN